MENFKALIHARDHHWPGLILGIGTIKTSQQAIDFDKAGADFLISPAFLPEIAATARQLGKLWVPGCMTPSEIAAAEQAGAKFIKLFPGNLLGPGFMAAIKELFPDLLFMPTGGVTPEAANLQQWFSAGVYAVGMGSQLISKASWKRRILKAWLMIRAKLLALVEARSGKNKQAGKYPRSF